ncbi:MAG: ABC transporter permease [archaeon]
MFFDFLRIAVRSLRRRGLRSWLTMVGIFIGIATVVALISLGDGLQTAVVEEFEKLGTDKIFIMPGSGFLSGPPGSIKDALTIDDVEIVRKVRGVHSAADMIFKVARVEFKDVSAYTYVIGAPVDGDEAKMLEEIQSWVVDEGRFFESGDKYNIVIGYLVAEENQLFDDTVNLRSTILIEDVPFKVVGILEPIGNPDDDKTVLMPIETARELFDEPTNADYVMVKVAKGSDPEKVAEDITRRLRNVKDVKEGEENFNVQTSAQLLETAGTVLDVITAVLIGIAAISIIVGGVGITNTMYTSVLERTKEVGIMKSIGAKNSDVLQIFLIEAGLLGMAGGAIGILIGAGLAKIVEISATQALRVEYIVANISPQLVIGALIFTFIVGAVAGTTPAVQASKMNPVDALRGK